MLQGNTRYKIETSALPKQLCEIPQPPDTLYVRGTMPDFQSNKTLCVVGARTESAYGRDVCRRLIEGLSGYPIIILSGLALGIDGTAHASALNAGLTTCAIPGSGLEDSVLYPRSHYNLAEQILASGGALLSEFHPSQKAAPWTFPQRNRIMAGLSDAVLVIECIKKSGTLITARLATEYNRDVATVPGSIFHEQSEGPHALLRLGATPITTSADILDLLSIPQKEPAEKASEVLSDIEQEVLNTLTTPQTRDSLLETLSYDAETLFVTLSTLELKGCIIEREGYIRRQ